jgi:hypothetical protein
MSQNKSKAIMKKAAQTGLCQEIKTNRIKVPQDKAPGKISSIL